MTFWLKFPQRSKRQLDDNPLVIFNTSLLNMAIEIVDLSMNSWDFPSFFVCLPEGNSHRTIDDHLVGGIPTPLKNMSSSVGMMNFPTEWKVIKFQIPWFQSPPTSHQSLFSHHQRSSESPTFDTQQRASAASSTLVPWGHGSTGSTGARCDARCDARSC